MGEFGAMESWKNARRISNTEEKARRDYSISKSLSRPDAFTKTEKVPLKARMNTFERFEPEEDL